MTLKTHPLKGVNSGGATFEGSSEKFEPNKPWNKLGKCGYTSKTLCEDSRSMSKSHNDCIAFKLIVANHKISGYW